jgi:hypothetical protein
LIQRNALIIEIPDLDLKMEIYNKLEWDKGPNNVAGGTMEVKTSGDTDKY